jgi:hypothetical protein
MKMWPSEADAARAYDIANIVLVVVLTIGAGATAVLVWMGNVKESYLKVFLAQSSERTAELEQTAEHERLERIKIEERIAPRRIDSEQQLALMSTLSAFSGHNALMFFSTDIEPTTFARALANVLKAAGWTVEEVPGILFGAPVQGVVVQVHAGATAIAMAAANALVDALKRQRFTVSGPISVAPNTGDPMNISQTAELAIVVGSK